MVRGDYLASYLVWSVLAESSGRTRGFLLGEPIQESEPPSSVPVWPLRCQGLFMLPCHVSGCLCSEALSNATVTIRTSHSLNKRRARTSGWHDGAWCLTTPDGVLVAAWGPALPLLSLWTWQRSSGWSTAGKGTSRFSIPDPGTPLIPP